MKQRNPNLRRLVGTLDVNVRDLEKSEHGCRTLDLVHVTIAVHWGCQVFVSADDRQIKAARFAGLETVDLRDLHRVHGKQAKDPGRVAEKPTRYGTPKRGAAADNRRTRGRVRTAARND